MADWLAGSDAAKLMELHSSFGKPRVDMCMVGLKSRGRDGRHPSFPLCLMCHAKIECARNRPSSCLLHHEYVVRRMQGGGGTGS